MVTEVEWEAADPGVDILIQEVSLMLVDVNAVNATPHESVFMSVEWLEDLLAPLVIHQGGQEGVGLFALLITSPSGVSF